ncbi:MAG: carbamoyltransferase HypF [candidate division WOR-3 bacterium]|nr:carbamoyltransferase HypF [candidate division WOR-3 bacterium]
MAKRLGIRGTVTNTRAGVTILAQGRGANRLLAHLQKHPPRLALISEIRVRTVRKPPCSGFDIIPSPTSPAKPGVEVLPDLATCSACRRELTDPHNRRYLYPFINCTQCGPRYTIILQLPYDRERTTMRKFRMCEECQKEYLSPANRRFHAEPIACPRCGPAVQLLNKKGRPISCDPIDKAARLILGGKILAVKGLGGFHLCCDARNDLAVRRLRRLKGRDQKPFALMVESLTAVRNICHLPAGAGRLLRSPAAPIVLLPKRKPAKARLAPLIAPHNPAYGILLPYTPLHLLIFKSLKKYQVKPPVLIMTSANVSDEPIAASEEELFNRSGLFDYVLTHNREIANRCDDSVIQAETANAIMVRRSRGYTPRPLHLSRVFHVKHPTLAVGADSKNCFALAAGGRVFAGPHIGELETAAAERFFLAALQRLTDWTGIKPARVVCDLHPDYSSVRLAETLSRKFQLPLKRVQHHYAHILSVMAEHGLRGPVLGLAADGTGYGLDRAIWGCEFLLINPDRTWKRLGHLAYLRHGASAGYLADPVQVAVSYLLQSGIEPGALRRLGLPVSAAYAPAPVITSSLGRLFDAVAAITGVCRRATFEGEPAIALENEALSAGTASELKLAEVELLSTDEEMLLLDPRPLIRTVFQLICSRVPAGKVSLWFHQTLVGAFHQALIRLAELNQINTICLSGGSFQNRLLRLELVRRLRGSGFRVYHNQEFPLNDGGIALGQAVALD